MENSEAIPLTGPVEIADRVWWVGHVLENDPFQCHAYLIEHGDQSVLMDPGSMLTIDDTLAKISKVTDFGNIRYFVCHHQDPDIASAMPKIDAMVDRDDAVVVSHWRAQALLKHYGLRLPFWLVEENEWRLDLGGRELRFVFTPYAHFPGAFVTFDAKTGTLFSSDLFGGFTEEFSLVARDEGHFENIRPFHEHYIPSNDILRFVLSKLEELPVKLIAPQHGSLIPEHLIDPIMSRLKTIDCGLYLLADENTGILALSKLNKALRDSMQTMIMSRNFSDIATSLLEIVQRFLPVQSMEFYSLASDGTMLHLAPETRFRGVVSENPPAPVAERLNTTIENWREGHRRQYTIADDGKNGAASSILLPLFDPESGRAHGIALLHADSRVENSEELEQLIETVALPLDIAVTRETAYRMLDLAAEKFYRQSTRDPLTGLYTRLYMQETVGRLIQLHDRDANARIGLMMADIDHFKKVNDTFGHNQGDVVLKRMAEIFRSMVRESDIPVRFGGEEFAIFVVGPAVGELTAIAERMRLAVEGMTLEDPMAGHRITVSFGVAVHQQGESLTDFIDRADEALYRAKETGRNRICKAEESGTPTQS